jgi:hypothetical protein
MQSLTVQDQLTLAGLSKGVVMEPGTSFATRFQDLLMPGGVQRCQGLATRGCKPAPGAAAMGGRAGPRGGQEADRPAVVRHQLHVPVYPRHQASRAFRVVESVVGQP